MDATDWGEFKCYLFLWSIISCSLVTNYISYRKLNSHSMVTAKWCLENQNVFTRVNQINWSCEINKHIWILRASRHCFIHTIHQLFSNHKFITSILYTALACVCSVSDCCLKHFTIQASCWLKDPPKLLKGKGRQLHQSLWLQSAAKN